MITVPWNQATLAPPAPLSDSGGELDETDSVVAGDVDLFIPGMRKRPTTRTLQSMRLTILVLAAALSGCASGGGGTGMSTERLGGEARAVSANLISAEEIATQTFQNAWQAVISLRPTWPKIPAYVKNARIAFERLQEVPIETVREIRLLSREQARVRFGPDAQQTILVVTR